MSERARVRQAVFDAGAAGLTKAEAMQETGIEEHTCGWRLYELERDGDIEDSGQRRLTPGHQPAVVYVKASGHGSAPPGVGRRDTSQAAHRAVAPREAEQRRKIQDFLARAGPSHTRDISKGTGLQFTTASARVADMKRDGLLVGTGLYRRTPSGRQAELIRLRQPGDVVSPPVRRRPPRDEPVPVDSGAPRLTPLTERALSEGWVYGATPEAVARAALFAREEYRCVTCRAPARRAVGEHIYCAAHP